MGTDRDTENDRVVGRQSEAVGNAMLHVPVLLRCMQLLL
jgi:hypothetical protein